MNSKYITLLNTKIREYDIILSKFKEFNRKKAQANKMRPTKRKYTRKK